MNPSDFLELPGCSRLAMVDARVGMEVSAGNLLKWRVTELLTEGVPQNGVVVGTLPLGSAAGRMVPNFEGGAGQTIDFPETPRNDASRRNPDRFFVGVIYLSSFVGAGFPILIGRHNSALTAQRQFLVAHNHSGVTRPYTSFIETATGTEIGTITDAAGTGNDGAVHAVSGWTDGVSVKCRLDARAIQTTPIAGVRDLSGTGARKLQIGNAGAALQCQARVAAAVWGECSDPAEVSRLWHLYAKRAWKCT